MRRRADGVVVAAACAVAVSSGAMVAAGCSSQPAASTSADPPCVAGLDAGCAATYDPPTFDTIFTNVFQTSCAVGTGSCHTADFGAGGIVFATAGAAYATLLGTNGGTPYVRAGDPGCSTLMKRLESTDPSYHMPRGPNSLSAGDTCTIVQWISEGAKR